MENLFGEKLKAPKQKVERTPRVYYVRDEEYCYFFVAKTPGEARYAYVNETGMVSFEETFYPDFTIKRVPELDKHIVPRGSGYQINPFEEEYWMKALYAEGGSFENGCCEGPVDKILSVEEMLARECRHEGGKKCEYWDDESIYINLPPKKKSV